MPPPRGACQPLTFNGTAAFAGAKLSRVLLVQLVFAVVVAACFMAFLAIAWVPVIRAAVHELPEDGAMIREEKLHWPDKEARVLSENSRLAFVVDPADEDGLGRVADLQIELCPDRVKLRSELGFMDVPYPAGCVIALNRATLDPWWGAREPWLVAIAGGAMAAKLFLSWWLLALLYAPVVKLLAFFATRDVTWRGAWRVACAALLPGALLMAGGILLYGLEVISLPWLVFLVVAPAVVGWVYLIGAPFRLAKKPAAPATPAKHVNPFMTPAAKDSSGPAAPAKNANPFATPAQSDSAASVSPPESGTPS
ncbi:MAG: hypothetical protein HY300_00975 [Verrucomicrobia bacterium]|nr:hypothetical protein [Verrucomicrobiota bacterium]